MKFNHLLRAVCLLALIVLPSVSAFGQCDDKPPQVKFREDPEKGNSVSGKWCWHPGRQVWVKQIMVYNGKAKPPADHPVYAYTNGLKCPDRPGKSDWEPHLESYKLFPMK